MKTLTLIGEPQLIANMLNKIYADNPGLTIIDTCASTTLVQVDAPKVVRIGQGLQPQVNQYNVFYLTYTDCDVLLDKNGEPLKF
jgi:hypothetical protein